VTAGRLHYLYTANFDRVRIMVRFSA